MINMEDYKQKYENALENFKKIKAANKDNSELVNFIEYEYPELKESEELKEAAKKHSCYNEDCEGAFYEPIVRNAFIAGANWQKEQMMKDAIEARVISNEGISCPILNEIHRLGLEEGDKVKLIIVKD